MLFDSTRHSHVPFGRRHAHWPVYPARTCIALVLATALTSCADSSGSGRDPANRASSATPNPTSEHIRVATGPVRADIRRLAADSYTADVHIATRLRDGTMLYVFHSVCTGSADGHCQAVDAFRDRSVNAAWHRSYTGVVELRPADDGFSVKVVDYAPSDPLCCPSRPPVVTVYTWNGSRIVAGPGSKH